MAAPLRFRAFRQTAILCSGSGQSLDMSAGGIAVAIGRKLDPGTEIELALDWTGLYHGKPRMLLTLWGEVLRSTETTTAIRILTHEFRGSSAAKAVA